ncbi:MAG: glycosyl transferase, partial [Sphingomonas sp.]
MTEVSVVTLGKGRPDHLVNVVRGLMRQTLMPSELIVAVMQDE